MSFRRISFIALLLIAICGFVAAQEHAAAPAEHKAEAAEPQKESPRPQTANVGEELSHASNEAAGRHEEGKHEEEQEEGAEFKQSSSVKFVANHTGLSAKGAYWVLVILNFAIIAGLVGWALKKNLPGMFRTRTETIRKSMDEAKRASDDANRRLGDIEQRLSRLDSEIADMKRTAEADAAAEEQRIRLAAEEDRKKILQMSEQEIEAAAKAARRELKAYAAELAVALAEKRIKVDAKTDEALVRNFVGQLGKDGR
jgi:F-type H+-transporting ATPase subunit b